MPRVEIKFFGPARDLAGQASWSLDVKDGETLGGIAGLIAEAHPELGKALGVRLAINRAYAPLDAKVSDGDEIAVIPPVSGGMPEPRVVVTRDPLDARAIAADLRTTQCGAMVTFEGVVRADERDGKTIVALDYEAYEDMAVDQLDAIRAKTMKRFDVLDVAISHRIGRVPAGETSTVIVVASGHRAEAFEACRWVIDAIKTDAPIWKKDIWADGSESWVDPICS